VPEAIAAMLTAAGLRVHDTSATGEPPCGRGLGAPGAPHTATSSGAVVSRSAYPVAVDP